MNENPKSTETVPIRKRIIQLAMQASIGQLVNGITHQLNNSLTPILGYSQLLQEKISEEESKTYLERLAIEANHLSQVVENMLTFIRRHNAGHELVNINDLIKKTVALQAYEIKKRDIAIQLQPTQDLPPIEVDLFQMQIVFLNIMNNALQAIGERVNEGTIIVHTSRSQVDRDRLRIQFIDNGPGIHPQILYSIFEPFFTTKIDDQDQAVGLGLTVCRHVIQEHKGQISVQSSLGQGATFTIELPIKETPLNTSDHAEGTKAISDTKKTG